MENSINIIAVILWTIMIIMLVELYHLIRRKIDEYFNPFNEYKWLDENMYRVILFDDPYIKGRQNLEGKLEYIGPSKNKRPNKKQSYDLGINIGGKNIMWIPITAKWSFKDAKTRP